MRWRGISIGTGFYYSKSETDIEILMDLDTAAITTQIPGYTDENVSFALQLDPSFTLEIENTTMTIPLDITTSWQLLWVLNFNLGAGVDFTYGSSDIAIKAAGDITTNIADDSDITANVEPGYLVMQGGAKGVKPSLLNYRITTGIGFNFSILKIDIPIAVYLDSGFSAGLTAGIVW